MAAAVPPGAPPGKRPSLGGVSTTGAVHPGEAMPVQPLPASAPTSTPTPGAAVHSLKPAVPAPDAAPEADNFPPPPPPITDPAEAPAADAAATGAAIPPAPGTFGATAAAGVPAAQEGAKKEYVAAIKSYEELVGGNLVRGKMYLESMPQYEAGPMGGVGFGGIGGGMGRGYPEIMRGYDRPPPMAEGAGYGGYDGQSMRGAYDGGYVSGCDRPPDMYGPPLRVRYSPNRGRYPSPDEGHVRRCSRGRKDHGYYYDELPRGSETNLPSTKKASESKAERIIQKIRQDIEAFDNDDAALDDVASAPSDKPSSERKPGPLRAMIRTTEDYEDDMDDVRLRDSDDYGRCDWMKKSKTRYDDDDDEPRRRKSRKDKLSFSFSSSSFEGHRRKKRHDSSDQGRKRSGSRRRRRTRSNRRGDERERFVSSRSRQRAQGWDDDVLQPRLTADRNFIDAGMLYRYESQPLMLVKGDVAKKVVPAQDGGAPENPDDVAQPARFSSPDQYQELLLDVQAGKRRQGYPYDSVENKHPPTGYQSFAVQAKPQTLQVNSKEEHLGFHDQVVPSSPPKPSTSGEVVAMQTMLRRTRSGRKGECYKRVEDTSQLKTEWWSRTLGGYGGTGKPVSRSRSTRGRCGLARSASPHMISPNRRKAYDDADTYQGRSLEMEGPIGQQCAQIRMRRRPGDSGRTYSINRRRSPTAVGYRSPQRVASPEMLPMQMQGMQIGGMQGMQMQGLPMQAMQGMPMQGTLMQGMPMMGMPMHPMAMQPMVMQGMPVQCERRSGRVPMRMDRRIHQTLKEQNGGDKRRSSAPTAMPVQVQVEGVEGVTFKYQIQSESRQRQADDGDKTTKDELVETSKQPSVERIVSSVEIQVEEKKLSKAANARVKTRASMAGTHDAGSTKNAEAQEKIDEIPHVSFTRNPNYDAPTPGYPFPTVPMFQSPSPQPSKIISTTTVHTHQHHHHYHEGQNNFKIAYLLPNSGDVRRVGSAQAQDCCEDQEPLVATVGAQCLSLYERLMNWIYPDTNQAKDVSVMTDAGELTEDMERSGKKGKKGAKKDAEGKLEDAKKDDKKDIAGESEAEAKGKSSYTSENSNKGDEKDKKEEKKKVPPGLPIPVNLPWQGHEYEEHIRPDGSRVGTYHYKGLGGAPKYPDDQGTTKSPLKFSDGQPSKEPGALETTTWMKVDGQEFWQREVRPIPNSARGTAMMPIRESRDTYQRGDGEQPSLRSVSTPQQRHVTGHSRKRVSQKGRNKDNFGPDVQVRLDFGDTSDNSGSRESKTKSSGDSVVGTASWQPADMVVSYAPKNYDDKNLLDDEDDDDDMLPSGNIYRSGGSTKMLIRRGRRKVRVMPNKELMAYSMVVLAALVGFALLIAMNAQRTQSRQPFILDRYLVLNASKFKAVQAGPAYSGFWNAAPPVCKDARCLTRGSAAVKRLSNDYLKSACADFYQFVCTHRNGTDSPRVIAHRALEDGVLNVIKAQDKFPELTTARHLYMECLNKEAISERGWDPLVELQKSTDLSGWPFTDPVQQPLIWRAAARLLRRFNLPALISIGVEKHPHKQGASILSIGHPKLLLSPRVGNWSVKWYYGAVMHALSPFRERLLVPVFAVEVSAFESRLANMLRAQPKMAVQKLADHPELTEFLSLALENITHVTKSTEFLVKDVDFLDDLLTAIKQTAPHIVLNYLGFREVVLASPFLPSKLQALSALGRSPSLRKEICLRVVAESLPVMSLYAGFNAFKLGLHNFKAANITAATKDAVSSFVRKINWMDDATKTRLSKKVLTSRVRAFYPDWIIDKFKVFAQYENVPMVTENEGLRSYASIRKALFENTLRTQSANVDDRWLGTILDPECSFDAQGTNIYAPVSFWNVSHPSHDNFLMVHMPDILPKISRCLVSQVLREGTGDHVSPYSKPAWSDVTKKHFQKTRECFAKQLSETASQNASETIYKQFVNQKNIDVKSFVKAFNMDVDQFFFVSYASSYCGSSPAVKPSQHSEVTIRDRVNTVLKNTPEFHAAFRCPSKRAMSQHCQEWRTS
ncbi:uncharacterized protein LOC119181885 isoform X2 [Rhipicephalus microplus]|uniref:uncharacterized protein LOC119181885 isoform X2 n=1 Tax=Rhipicephalus microplus TaxID=6941 RepID=UPI003F6BD41F